MFDSTPTISAREATPGTVVVIESSTPTDFGVQPTFERVVVDHWVPCGGGFAGLVGKRGGWYGKFRADDRLKPWIR